MIAKEWVVTMSAVSTASVVIPVGKPIERCYESEERAKADLELANGCGSPLKWGLAGRAVLPRA